MKSISQFRLRKLICRTEVEQDRESDIPEHVYASFLFKDRVTHQLFRYREAVQNSQNTLDLKDCLQKDSKDNEKLNEAIRTYKFAKKFGMNCIRNKYYEKKSEQSKKKITENQSKNKEQNIPVQQARLLKVKCDQVRKIINQAEHSQSGILNSAKEKEQKKREKETAKWCKLKEAKKEDTTLGESGERLYQAAMAHLACETKDRGEYLLNVPTLMKRKNLIKEQLKHSEAYKLSCEAAKSPESESKSPFKAVIDNLQFSPFNKSQFKTLCKKTEVQQTDQNTEFLRLVRLGFLNQALAEAKKQPLSVQAKDSEGNNAFHLCVVKGDQTMCLGLLSALPLRVCSKLLQRKNKLGRTALQKAAILRQPQILKILVQYSKENKLPLQTLSFRKQSSQQLFFA